MRARKRINKKKIIFIISLILLLLIVITALYINRTAQSEIRHIWVNKWLTKEAGLPPCWENICPGKTSNLDAKDILSGLPEINDLGGVQDSSDKDGSSIRWNFEHSTDGGEVTFSRNDSLVSTISLNIDFRQYLKVAEVINTYGEPTNLLVYYCRDHQCLVDLLYIDQGFLVETISEVDQKNVVITKDLIITTIRFFPNSESGYRNTVGVGKLETGILYKWNGFTRYGSTR